MFNFLKKFKKIKKRSSVEISFDEVLTFIEEHIKKTSKIDYTVLFLNIKQYLDELKIKVDELSDAKLRNKKIDKKLIQLMQGNRDAYIKRVGHFFHNFSLPNNYDSDTLNDFIQNYRENIEQFNKNTSRAFYVLREFFGNEVGAIAQILKKLDNKMVSLESSFKDEPTQLINKVYGVLSEIKGVESKKESILNESKKINDTIDYISEEIKELIKNFEIIKKGSAYGEISSLVEEREKLNAKIQEISNNYTNKFSKLNFLAHKSGDRLLKIYIEDPILALEGDRELRIFSVLQNNRGVADKVKNSDEAISLINLMTLDFFKSFRFELEELQDNKKEISSKIVNNSIMRELSEKEYRKDHLVQKVERLKEELDSLSKAKLKYKTTILKKQLAEDLTHLTQIEVNLK